MCKCRILEAANVDAYYCLTNSRYKRGACPGVCIEEQELRAIVTELLIRAINLELGKSVSGLKKAASQDIEEVICKEISSKHQELERNRKFLRGLFEHLVQHLITQEEYQSIDFCFTDASMFVHPLGNLIYVI